MKDQQKTKHEMLRELGEMRQLVAMHQATEEALRGTIRDLQQRVCDWRSACENARDIFFVQNLEGTYLSVNNAVESILGYTPEEFRLLDYKDVLDSDYIPLIEEHFSATLRSGRSTEACVVLARSKSHDPVWLDITSSVVLEDGRPVGIQGVARNISGRRVIRESSPDPKKVEDTLHMDKVRFRTLLEYAPFGLILIDASGTFRYVNPRFEHMFGYNLSDIPDTHTWFARAFPDTKDRQQTVEAWADERRNPRLGAGHAHVFTVRCKDGTEKDVQFRPVRLVGGEYMVTCEDITELRRAEKALHESERRYRSLVETAKDLIWTVDLALQYTYVSPSVKDVLGYTVEEALSRNAMADILPPSREMVKLAFEEELCEQCEPTVPSPSARVLEVEHYHKDGSVRWMEMTVAPLREKTGRALGLLGISRDITERKRMDVELQEALAQATQLRAEAETANRAKSEFLANMSHELRTPMNAIIGFSEILEDQSFGTLNENQLKYVRLVLSSGYHLLQLINDVLDLEKIESGKMPLRLSRVDVGRLLHAGLTMVKEKALKHGVEVNLHTAPGLEATEILADEVKLKQVLFNLLANATKFTPRNGRIDLSARTEGGELIISVSDTGIGLAPEDRDRIFGTFEQVDSSYARTRQGSGLGLALSRKLVDMHGGRIWAESPGEGQGSVLFSCHSDHPRRSCQCRPI